MITSTARSVIVTGASSTIGTEVATLLATEGALLTVTYRNQEAAALDLVSKLRERGGVAQAVPYDLAEPESAHQLVKACLDAYGRLDAVVANAVSWPPTGPGPMPDSFDRTQDWESHFVTNAVGTMTLAHAAIPALRKSEAGRLVLVGTSVLRHPVPGSSVYCAAKASLQGLMTGLVWDVGPDGVLINVVMPGWVVDPELIDLGADSELATLINEHTQKTPLGRAVHPRDVASLINYLISPDNNAVNGETIAVTGGY